MARLDGGTGRAGEANSQEKKHFAGACQGQGWCVAHRGCGVFPLAPDTVLNPSRGMGICGGRVTQTQPNPQPLHLLGAALFYFITNLFM